MQKIIIIKILLLFFLSRLNAQNCYTIIGDFTGISLNENEQLMDISSCELKDTLPITFQNQFRVFDFGFYRLGNVMNGGQDRVWNSKINQVQNTSTYYVLFGTELNNTLDDKIRVEINLPNSGDLSCITNDRVEGLKNESSLILAQQNKSNTEKKVEVLNLIKQFITQSLNCCLGEGQRMTSFIDTSLLDIGVCLGNCGLDYVENNEIAIIENNEMPTIGFKLIYPEQLFSCTEFYIRFSIKYIKDVNGNERDRDDLFLTSYSGVYPNDYIQIDFDSLEVFDIQWPLIQGGRAKIEILDNALAPNPIRTFDFTVKGHNPTIATVMEHLEGAPYDDFWFFKKLIMHESGTFSQNATEEIKQFNPFDENYENLHETWDAFSRCPNASANNDGGFGLTQLTNPIPSSQALWDWKCNLYGAYDLLVNNKRWTVNAFFDSDFILLNEWNNNPVNESDQIEKVSINYADVTWVMSSSDAFGGAYQRINDYFDVDEQEGQRSFLDACLMIAYNGYGGMNNNNFVHLVPGSQEAPKPYWTTMDNQNNYVEEVTTKQVPFPY